MSFRKILFLFFISTLLVSSNACLYIPITTGSKSNKSDKPPQKSIPDKQQTSNNHAKKASTRPDDDYDKYMKEISVKFNQKQFAFLDDEARKLRREKTRLTGGYWKLRAFYKGIESPLTDDGWESHINLLREWIKQNPKSVTAHVGLALSHISYAWVARGDGYANTVSEEGWKLLHERLAEAEAVLANTMSLTETCPQLYVAWLMLARAQGWDLRRYEMLFSDAIKIEPTYYYFYQEKAMNLLPRWHGEPGDWEGFVDSIIQTVPGDEAAVIYFQVYSLLMPMHGITFIQEHYTAWENLYKGFQVIDRKYGMTPLLLNQACYMAMSSNHAPVAVELFDRIGEDWHEDVWEDKSHFEGTRMIARQMVDNYKKKLKERNIKE